MDHRRRESCSDLLHRSRSELLLLILKGSLRNFAFAGYCKKFPELYPQELYEVVPNVFSQSRDKCRQIRKGTRKRWTGVHWEK